MDPGVSVYHFIKAVCVFLTDILGHGNDTHFQHIGAECHADLVSGLKFEPGFGDTSVDLDSSLLTGLLGHGAPFYYS